MIHARSTRVLSSLFECIPPLADEQAASSVQAGGACAVRRLMVPVQCRWPQKPLNFVERMMAYGVHIDPSEAGKPLTFSIVPLPERTITLAMGADHRPQARMKIGDHMVRLAYVYLNVIDGLIPKVPSLDIFGTDIVTGKAIREHLVEK